MAYTSASDALVSFFDHLVRSETRLYNAANDRLRARHGIVASQFELLRYLRRHPGARVVDLAETFAAGVGAISKGVDRLVQRGWVVRHPHPEDGRSSLVSLTDAGSRLVDEAEETFRRLLAEIVPLPSAELEKATAALADLRAGLEAARLGVPVG